MESILVINNDIDTMKLLKNLLERADYSVTYTSSKEEALHLINKNRPTLVLIDIMQKDILPLLKKDNKISKIPVVLMSGYSLRDSQTEILADDIIEKPFVSETLLKKIKYNIEKKAA